MRKSLNGADLSKRATKEAKGWDAILRGMADEAKRCGVPQSALWMEMGVRVTIEEEKW